MEDRITHVDDSPHENSEDRPRSRTGRKRGGVWRYFFDPAHQHQKSKRAQCMFCEKSLVAQSDRMRSHIQHSCSEAPNHVKSELWKDEIASCSLTAGRLVHHDELGPIKFYKSPSQAQKTKQDDFQIPQEELAVSLFHGTTKQFDACESDTGTRRRSHSLTPNRRVIEDSPDEDGRERKNRETKIRDRYDAFGALVSNQIRSLPVNQGNKMMKKISEILFEDY